MNHQLIQEYLDDWDELEAYRNLSGQPFDFGAGLINDDSTQSEDVYWKIDQWNIERIIDDLLYQDESKNKKQKHKYNKINHYQRKYIDKNKLIKLYKITGYGIVYYNEKEDRYIRIYESRRKGFAKWCSKRKVRNSNNFSLKGSGYRKVFDYWYYIW